MVSGIRYRLFASGRTPSNLEPTVFVKLGGQSTKNLKKLSGWKPICVDNGMSGLSRSDRDRPRL